MEFAPGTRREANCFGQAVCLACLSPLGGRAGRVANMQTNCHGLPDTHLAGPQPHGGLGRVQFVQTSCFRIG